MSNKIKRVSIIIVLIIGLPLLADTISNFITIDMIMKCVYLVLGLILIGFWKVGRNL